MLEGNAALAAMVRDGPSGLLTMRLRSDALPHPEEGQRPVSKPHPEEPRSGVSKDEEPPKAGSLTASSIGPAGKACLNIIGRRIFWLFLIAVSLPLSLSAQQQKIRIATEGANPPFSTINSSGELEGFDVEIARALCTKMSADCEIAAQDWDGIIPALLARKYDAIIASLSVTEDRKNVVAFTKPYYHSPGAFVVRKGTDLKDLSPRALTGKSIGVQTATNQAAFLEDRYSRSIVRLYNTVADAYRDLAAGRVEYVMYDKLAVYDWLKSPDGACCEMAPGDLTDAAYFGGGMAIALRKGDDALVKRFNDAIDGIVADGTYARINAKYFPFPVF